MDQQCQLLLYLDRKKVLLEMERSCRSFLDQLDEAAISKFPPHRFLLELDVMEMLDGFPDLGQSLLREPLRWNNDCNKIFYCCMKTINSRFLITPAQVIVNLRVKCLPRLLSQLNNRTHRGLETFTGILLTVSKPSNYVYHTVWSCPEECEENEVVLQYIPKVPPKCYTCKTTLYENSGLRRCGEQVEAIFLLSNDILPKRLKIVDDLTLRLKLGSKYNIHAMFVKKDIRVWSIEETFALPAPVTTPFPEEIGQLFRACKGIPWQFIYCLASSIGANVCPLHCFMQLKISLLLSLVSVKAHTLHGSSIFHVLVAGEDTGYVSRIMAEAAKLANRFIRLGTSNTTASQALIGSAGGVCLMSLPLHVYSKKELAAVLGCLETGDAVTETGAVKISCAVWAHGMDYKRIAITNVASVFGTICKGDDNEYADEIADFALQNATEPPSRSKEDEQTMREIAAYVERAGALRVQLDAGAEALLREYFLAVRRERPRGGGGGAGALRALAAAAAASAQLCGETRAGPEHALLAVWLHAAGAPPPRFAPDEYLHTPADVKTLRRIMTHFKTWLERFTGYEFDEMRT